MTIGIWRGKELVESLGEVGEFVSFSTTVTDAEEFGMYAECTQVASETGGSELRDECRGSTLRSSAMEDGSGVEGG